MAKNIRTLVAIAATPLFLAIGSAHAQKAVAPEPGDIVFDNVCILELDATEVAIREAYHAVPSQFLTSGAYTNYLNLLSKLVGVDIKLNEEKPADAYMLLGDIMDKVTAWSDYAQPKPKLTTAAAASIGGATYAAMACIGAPY